MELTDVIKNRRSIRKFKTTPISDELISELLEAARWAPSGSNIQPWRFIIVKSSEIKEKLKETTPYRFACNAPVVFACCADITSVNTREKRIKELIREHIFKDIEIGSFSNYNRQMDNETIKRYVVMNTALAIEHIILKAVDLGLSTCWVGGFDNQKARNILELPENVLLIALLPIGYAAQAPPPRPRIPLDDLILKTV